jgi:hypothetical protein
MVSAIKGVLISTDEQLKEIVKSFNASAEPEKRFIIADVSKTQLLIKSDSVDRVKEEVKKYGEALHFEVDKSQQ